MLSSKTTAPDWLQNAKESLLDDEDYIEIPIETLAENDEQKKITVRIARGTLNFLTLVFGSAMEALQFLTGLKDINSKLLGFIPVSSSLSWILGGVYLAQAVAVNRKFTVEGIDQLIEFFQGKPLPGSEPLSKDEARKANSISGSLNIYAIFSDAAETAYYLEKQKFSSNRIANFILGIFVALSTIPTEVKESHLLIQSYFSTSKKIAESLLNQIKETSFYQKMVEKCEFEALWAEFSMHLKIALVNPLNEAYLKDKKKLPDEFIASLQNGQDAMTTLFTQLKIDPTFAAQLTDLLKRPANLEEKEEKTSADTKTNPLFSAIDTLIKVLLNTFSTLQDMTESYTGVAAMAALLFNITTPYLRTPLFILSAANGLNDLLFTGKNTREAVDQFKKSIAEGNYSAAQIAQFLPSLFLGLLVGHTQYSLIDSELKSPDAPLPPPLPKQLPETLSLINAWGSAVSSSVLYTRYFWMAFQGIIDTFSWLTTDEKKQLKETIEIFITQVEDDWQLITINPEQHESSGATISPNTTISASPSLSDDDEEEFDDLSDIFPENKKNTSSINTTAIEMGVYTSTKSALQANHFLKATPSAVTGIDIKTNVPTLPHKP
ncbi:MAG: hypothetical protein ACD_60C00005G0014 [uncultured bacterium]|nr:MAG: hypothetical protein ACD_60C00005G0014 [uncultured bacterium]